MIKILRQTWILAVGLMLGLSCLSYVAWCATYNFYFNNTEQGDNSTATPTVTVSDGKATKSGAPEPAPSVVPAPTAVADANKPADAAAPLAATEDPNKRSDLQKVGDTLGKGASAVGGAVSTSAAFVRDNVFGAPEFGHFRLTGNYANVNGRHAATGGLAYHFIPEIGISLYFGGGDNIHRETFPGADVFGGAELEIVPLRISVGRFEHAIELGALAGVSTLHADVGNWVSPHVGSRLNLNLGKRWSLTGTIRGNASYIMGEGGLAIRI